MSGEFALDWAVMAVSLFNTVILFWLGLTVLLNAERRSWGIWLAGIGLLMAAAFFVSHSAILGHDLYRSTLALDFWWWVGWLPVVAAPCAWYVLMLWYAGFWDGQETALRRRHRLWLPTALLPAVVFAGLLLFANPLPSFWQVSQLELSASPAAGDLPLLILLYPFYNVLCIALSLDVLRRPGPAGRVMGDLARRRAQPWLVAAATTLLLVSFLVAWAMFWILSIAHQRTFYQAYSEMARTLAFFDLTIATLIALAVILLGQAVVAYEVFTGKTLPRRGLARHWRRALILAAGYALVVGLSLTVNLLPIYSLLLTAILMTLFYALLSWRSYVERERTIENLRPFVASQRLYDQLLAPSSSFAPDLDGTKLLGALCGDLLGAQLAFLLPLGALAPLIDSPFSFPAGVDSPSPLPAETVGRLDSPSQICLPVDPARHGGAIWAVPLWSERGLIGVLLLGPKQGGGLYSQEEIEIARSSGERLMDNVASSELAGRLMALQRQRLAASQVVDRQTRRVLHDDVLPQLHAAMLTLSPVGEAAGEVMEQLAEVHRQLSDLLREMPATGAPELARQGLPAALQQLVERELRDAFDGVSWGIDTGVEADLRQLSPLTVEVLYYAAREAIRNAARHGRGRDKATPLHLRLEIRAGDGVEIVVEDDGRGMGEANPSPEAGHGLALHSTMMAVIGGTMTIESRPGEYTRVRLILPVEAGR